MTQADLASARLEDLSGLVLLGEATAAADPRAVYRRLALEWGPVAPVDLEPGVPAWLAMGYREIVEVLRNEAVFSKDTRSWRWIAEGRIAAATSPLAAFLAPRDNAMFTDGKRRERLRAALDDAFANQDELAVGRSLRALCDSLLDDLVSRGEADLVREYAEIVPVLAVGSMLGLSPDAAQAMLPHLRAVFAGGPGVRPATSAIHRTFVELSARARTNRAMSVLLRDDPGPVRDLTEALVAHPNLETDVEVSSSLAMTMISGCQMEIAWIAQTFELVLTDAQFAGRVRGGRLGLDDALDEVLWREPPSTNLAPRFATHDVELGGVRVAQGDAVVLGIAAANAAQEQAVVDDPWAGVGNRAHLTWGAGPHRCPAERSARFIARIAVERALARFEDLELAIPAESLRRVPTPWTRHSVSLPVRYARPVVFEQY